MEAYGTDDGLQAWLQVQGLVLPDGVIPQVVRTIGSGYLDAAYEAKLQCSQRTGGFEQELAWPRTGHRVNGQDVPPTLIPPAWIKAAYRAAYLEATNPGWATATNDPNRVTKREKVDVIEREFMTANDLGQGTASAFGIVSDAIINGMVTPWLCTNQRTMGDLFRVI